MLLKGGPQTETPWNFLKIQIDWTLAQTFVNRSSRGDSMHSTAAGRDTAPRPTALFSGGGSVQWALAELNWLLPFEWSKASSRSTAFCLQGLNKCDWTIRLCPENTGENIKRQLLPAHSVFTHLRDFKEQRLLWSVTSELNTSQFRLHNSANADYEMESLTEERRLMTMESVDS